MKKNEIDLSSITLKLNLETSYTTDEQNDTIKGKIMYDLDEEIGDIEFNVIFGSSWGIFQTLDNISVYYLRFAEEIFKNTDLVKKNYERLIDSDSRNNRFIILDRIQINENYRGHGVLQKVIEIITRVFNHSIITIPFPLQHGEGDDIDESAYKKDLAKVVEAYKKCGFKRGRKGSSYFVLWSKSASKGLGDCCSTPLEFKHMD